MKNLNYFSINYEIVQFGFDIILALKSPTSTVSTSTISTSTNFKMVLRKVILVGDLIT